jgi:hypothetical protein
MFPLISVDGTVSTKPQIIQGEIVIEIGTLDTGNIIFAHRPKKYHQLPQPEVVESLERSLEENAAVWEELSKL